MDVIIQYKQRGAPSVEHLANGNSTLCGKDVNKWSEYSRQPLRELKNACPKCLAQRLPKNK